MIKALSLGGLSWKDLAKRVWAEIQEDEILGRAAQLSYYFLLALFPLLLFLTSVIGLIAGEDNELRTDLFKYLSTVLPGSAVEMVSTSLGEAIKESGGGKISFGILATMWAASNGMGAISESLNVAYDVKETRPWWKSRLVAVLLTFSLATLIITALVLVLYGHDIAETVAGSFGLGSVFEIAWKILQWPLVLAFVLFAFALIYYFGPDLHDQDWKWVSPGAVIGVALWLLISFGFKAYLEYFDSYSATYGSLGAVIILMLWFYFTGLAILVGGEINSEVEHEMAKRGAPDAKEKGEKAPNEKGGGQGSEQSGGTRENDKARARSGGEAVGAAAGSKGGGASRPKASTGREVRARETTATAPASPVSRIQRRTARRFSLGKAVVVLGAWALSKVKGSSGKQH